MANDILKEEIMNEEELESVAGGTGAETKDDIKRFKALGILPQDTGEKDADALKRAFAIFDVRLENHRGYLSDNEYYYMKDGKRYDRKTAWNYIYSRCRR